MDKISRINKIIKEAESSLLMDNLPLSKEYVEEFKNNKINQINNSKKLVLKRGNNNGK